VSRTRRCSAAGSPPNPGRQSTDVAPPGQFRGVSAELAQVTGVAPERAGDDYRGRAVVAGGVLDAPGQHRVRADLGEQPVARVNERPRDPVELHGAAQAAAPEVRVHGPGEQAAHRAGVHGDPRRPGRDRAHARLDLFGDLVDVRAVSGQADLDDPGPHAVSAEPGHLPGDGLDVTRDDHLVRAIDGGDDHPARPATQARFHGRGRERHDRHVPAAVQPGLAGAPDGPDPRGILEGERARHAGGGDLPEAVPGDGIRHHAVLSPQGGKRHHEREHHRLAYAGGSEIGRTRQLPQHINR
jgi:hypothetical protein